MSLVNHFINIIIDLIWLHLVNDTMLYTIFPYTFSDPRLFLKKMTPHQSLVQVCSFIEMTTVYCVCVRERERKRERERERGGERERTGTFSHCFFIWRYHWWTRTNGWEGVEGGLLCHRCFWRTPGLFLLNDTDIFKLH